jgi:hypothetical protein
MLEPLWLGAVPQAAAAAASLGWLAAVILWLWRTT